MKKSVAIMLLISIHVAAFGQQIENKGSEVVFYRSKKMSSSATMLNIGSPNPDTVFVKLKNGTYHILKINDFREWEFVGGLLKITAYQKVTIEPGKKYYINCYLRSSFPSDKCYFELVDEQTAKIAMQDMKECD